MAERRTGATQGGGSFVDQGVFKPMIAAIDGFCVAGGLELSLQCDIRIATRKSEFGLPEPRWSLLAGYALNWTRLSCHRFVANQVRLWLFIPSTCSGQAWPTTWATS